MLTKKYPPITLTEANMMTLHHAQEGIRFILGDELKRILHMTMDFERGTSGCGHKSLTAEFQITALCKNGKTISTTVEITAIVHEEANGWTIGMGNIGLETKFEFVFRTRCGIRIEVGFEFIFCTDELLRCTIWIYEKKTAILEARMPDDPAMLRVRELILE